MLNYYIIVRRDTNSNWRSPRDKSYGPYIDEALAKQKLTKAEKIWFQAHLFITRGNSGYPLLEEEMSS